MSGGPRITVVGLGPAGPELVTTATAAAIAAVPPEARFLRTERHPAASILAGATTFDAAYDDEATFDDVYERIVGELLAAAVRLGHVLYAVPGSPRVLERTVDLLVTEAAAAGVDVEVLPALSFLDLAWVKLGVDPLEDGVRLIDGHRFAELAAGERGPLLIAHCHNQRVLSDVKLAFEVDAPARAIVLQRLGLPDEHIVEVEWSELDRAVTADHLTAVYVAEAAAPVARELQRFDELVRMLRERCPWDREQTHTSLTRHLLEETYEVLEAIAALGAGGAGDDHLEEELGDLLFQVVFHTTLARERGAFTLADVARGIHDKLVRRHPHVFGDDDATSIAALEDGWEARKQKEKGRASVFDGIPTTLPALAYANTVLRKAASFGASTPLESTAVIDSADALGDALFGLVAAARHLDIDPEAALRAAVTRTRANWGR